jgi:anti-sigma B factor antagonist
MEIATKQYKHCDLLVVQGKVDSYTAPDLTKAIEELNNKGQYTLVLDLGKLEYMSSAGFRALLIGQRNCKRYNRGEIVLAAVPKKVMDALELTGFTPLFRVFDDVLAAVGSF